MKGTKLAPLLWTRSRNFSVGKYFSKVSVRISKGKSAGRFTTRWPEQAAHTAVH